MRLTSFWSTAVAILVIASVGRAQPAMKNLTGHPNDIAAARMLGYVDGVLAQCPDLESNPGGHEALARMGGFDPASMPRDERLRRAFEAGRANADRQQFDPECALVMRRLGTLVRVKPGRPEPTGPGYTQQIIEATPLPLPR